MEHTFSDTFLEFEKKYNLLQIKEQNISIWLYIRFWCFAEIRKQKYHLSNFYSETKENLSIDFKNILLNVFRIKKIRKSDILFLSHPRRVLSDDNYYYCKVTDPIIDIVKDKYTYTIWEEPLWAELHATNVSHYKPIPNSSIFYSDFLEYIFFIKSTIWKKIKRGKLRVLLRTIDNIIGLINMNFGVDISGIKNDLLDIYLYVLLMEKKYIKIIKKISPKIILGFYCPVVRRTLLVKISKDLKVPFVDVQHGPVGIEDPILYKFPYKGNFENVPDYIFTFGKILFNTKNFPYLHLDAHIFPIGYPFLQNYILKHKNVTNYENIKYILIISQPVLGDILSEFAATLAALLQNYSEYRIIYKLHPYETGRIYEIVSNKNNIEIIDSSKEIYYYQNFSYVQIGGFSTALCEGIAFNLPTFLLSNCYGERNMRTFFNSEDKGIYFVNNAQQAFKILMSKQLDCPEERLKRNIWQHFDESYVINKIEELKK